jgi:chromosomal replication initiator protein
MISDQIQNVHKSSLVARDENFYLNFTIICKREFGETNFERWLKHLAIVIKSEHEIIFSAPSKFIRDWVVREFLDKKEQNLIKAVNQIEPKIKKISVIHVEKQEEKQSEKNNSIPNLSKHNNVFAFGTELNSKYTFENFVSAKYNKLALSMAKITAGLDAQINLFDDKIPLFIHGGVGVGKTHLAQAIAWHIKENDKLKKVVYLSAEKFMYHFVQSIRGNDVMSFKEKMRSIDVLIVDDLHFITGKESTQQEFMNCFNSLVEDNKQVVLVCDRCPSDLENIDEKLKSRISGGMIVNFKNPDYQDRLAIIKTKVKDHKIPDEIISFLAEKITTNIRDLEGAMKKLIAAKLFLNEEINLENAKTILADYIKASGLNFPNIAKIQKTVANFFGIKISDLLLANRSKQIVVPRQIAMYLAKKLTSESLPKIGQEFGNKNHATVIHAIKSVEKMINLDQKISVQVKTLEEKLFKS